jgi:hypothetical protein
MTGFDWLPFLRRWSDDVLGSDLAGQLPDSIRKSGWLGFAPATDQHLTNAERRLGMPLPASYAAFLRVTDGWARATRSIGEVWGIDRVDSFRKSHRDWIRAMAVAPSVGEDELPDAEYFAYSQHSLDFKAKHLRETLQISEVGDAAVYLLNPQVITKDGEWEEWFLASWLPGVRRYRSFQEMMQSEFYQFAGIEWQAPVGVIGELPDEYIDSPGSTKRRIKKRRRPTEPKVLRRPLSKWTAEELLGYLENPEFDIIHNECIGGLVLLGDPRAVEPLLARLPRNDIAAAHALKQLAPERLRGPLLAMLAEWPSRLGIVFSTAGILAELREDRAIPILIEMMNDERPEFRFVTEYVSQFLAQFGSSGYAALVAELKSASPLVRQRAARGLFYSNKAEARDLFENLLSDHDPQVRETAALALKVLPPKRRK